MRVDRDVIRARGVETIPVRVRVSIAAVMTFLVVLCAACTSHPVPGRVLEVAPTPCPVSPAQWSYGIRSSAPAVGQLRGYAPRWVPTGFSVSGIWRSRSGPGGRVTWTGTSCGRQVWVTYMASGAPATPLSTNLGHVGAWTVGVASGPQRDPRQCAETQPKPATCLLFYETTTSKGTISIMTLGISRTDGDRVARSIPI
jgi:hypothetical protein